MRDVLACDAEHHCVTCGDDGVSMRVERVDAGSGLARCLDEHGVEADVEIALVGDVTPGDELLVHAGVALMALSSQAAA
jgi:hydrogenase maturation factor